MLQCNSSNYLYHPNLLLIVNKSKNMEVNEMTKPDIINGLDLTLSFLLALFLDDTKLLFLLERRLGKGLITINLRSKLITLKF